MSMPLPVFLIPMLVGLSAQAAKPFFNRKWYARLKPEGRVLPRYGGMPSAHTAFAAAIATTVGWVDGIGSGSFVIAAALAILILDDALRLRIFLSRHGEALARLVARLPAKEQKDFPYLESRLGHKPVEVVVGAIWGFLLSSLLLWALL